MMKIVRRKHYVAGWYMERYDPRNTTFGSNPFDVRMLQ